MHATVAAETLYFPFFEASDPQSGKFFVFIRVCYFLFRSIVLTNKTHIIDRKTSRCWILMLDFH